MFTDILTIMKLLATCNQNEIEPTDYTVRPTVKAVVIDENKNIAIFSGLLLGGGIEDDETAEQALHRECMEEAGITIKILKSLGTVIQYRDEIKKKYEVQGFIAQLVSKEAPPTTHQEDEFGKGLIWIPLSDAKELFEKRIEELKSNPDTDFSHDAYQGKLYNTMTALIFLNEAISYLQK